MTNEVQQTRWDQLIRRVSGSIGPGSRVAETLAELFPVIDVENLPSELLLLAGWRLAYGGALLAPSVGNNQHVQLFNPADSGQLISATFAYVTSDTAQRIEWDMEVVAIASAGGGEKFRDTRLGTIGGPTGQIRNATTAAGLPVVGSFFVQAGVTFLFAMPNDLCVLAPGSGITIATTTFNTELQVSFNWRERIALEAELNF